MRKYINFHKSTLSHLTLFSWIKSKILNSFSIVRISNYKSSSSLLFHTSSFPRLRLRCFIIVAVPLLRQFNINRVVKVTLTQIEKPNIKRVFSNIPRSRYQISFCFWRAWPISQIISLETFLREYGENVNKQKVFVLIHEKRKKN